MAEQHDKSAAPKPQPLADPARPAAPDDVVDVRPRCEVTLVYQPDRPDVTPLIKASPEHCADTAMLALSLALTSLIRSSTLIPR